MGQTRTFVCPGCGYEAEVSGGPDAGMACCTTTILCLDCKEIMDVVTAQQADLTDSRFTEVAICCEHDQRHEWREWNPPDTCPKCGQTMQIDPNGTVAMWD